MSQFRKQAIGSLCSRVCSGGTPKSSVAEYYGGDIPWLNTKEVNFNRIYGTENSITQIGLDNSSAKWIRANTVIVAMYGATAGRAAICKVPLTTNQACCNLEIDERKADYRFVYYAICNNYTRLALAANGGAQQNLNAQMIKAFEIPLPSLSIQYKIAAILSSLDDKIENNNAIRKNLEEQALICFCQTFIESASNKASRPIYEFAEFINGSSFRQSELTYEGLPIIKIGELKAGISATTLRYSGDICKKVLINDGDILFSWSGNPQTSIDVFIWCGGSGVLNQHIFKVKSLFDCPWFTYLLLKYLMPQFVSIASDKQTTGLGHVTAGDLKRLKFPHDLGKMQSFESTIAPIMLGVYNSMLENVKLLSLRDTLLPKLMRGEIDI